MNNKNLIIIGILLLLVGFGGGIVVTKTFNQTNPSAKDKSIQDEAKNTSTSKNTTNSNTNVDSKSSYFTEAKLSRNTQSDLTISNLKQMLNDKNLDASSRKNISDKVNTLTINANNQTKIEEELKTKGFKDAVCYIENNKARVVVQSDEKLTEEQNKIIRDVVASICEVKDVEITNHRL